MEGTGRDSAGKFREGNEWRIQTPEQARERASGGGASSVPAPRAVLGAAWREFKNKDNPAAVRLRYLERIGENLGLWGSKAKPRETPEAIPPVVEEEDQAAT